VCRLAVFAAMALLAVTAWGSSSPAPVVRSVDWVQADPSASFTLALERRQYTALDRGGRIVLAVQAGRGQTPQRMTARWSIARDGTAIHQGEAGLAQGMAVIDFDLSPLQPGDYTVDASLLDGGSPVTRKSSGFQVLSAPAVVSRGRVPLVLPRGVRAGDGVTPLQLGVPFPKGALTDLSQLRLVDAQGRPVSAQFTVRSRWGYRSDSSVRWLGIDLQSPSAPAWWPQRQAIGSFLEFGEPADPLPMPTLRVEQAEHGLHIDTGAVAFNVRRRGFNLVDDVTVAGRQVLGGVAGMGPYLVDHEGSIYRAANDDHVDLRVEERNALRVVVRAEGWYVKDGSNGSRHAFTLPTDRISRFITRIEAYAGQPTIRVQHTWIITYDSFSVRLRDAGLVFPAAASGAVEFGVLDAAPIVAAVPERGVHLLQHRHNEFDVQTGDGVSVARGRQSDGSARVRLAGGHTLGLSLRQIWQRFPKEIEILPDQVRLHVWPVHGKTHPKIDPYAPDRYHQLWFAHQGRELNLVFPWETLFRVMNLADNPELGVYDPAGTAMGGVHASAMGVAITSDLQLSFTPTHDDSRARQLADTFAHHPLALAHPDWLAASDVMGPIHPYDPQAFAEIESTADRMLRAYRDLQDQTGEFGMFLYRVWHHSEMRPDGVWNPYRLYSAGHHYEPYMPWLYYARSGNPDHFDHADSSSRSVSDLGIIHHDEPQYVHREYSTPQARVVGSTRHTNGFVLWGGDHALLGHQTSYNAYLLAHYLTGDLRYREILVNEWQPSLMDRTNPEVIKAIRLEPGRENNNALGELIDLYQLTYDPRLLAYIEPCIERYLASMRNWGLPAQNVLAFNGHPQARQQLLASLGARQKQSNADEHGLFSGLHHAGLFALGSGQAPGRGFAVDALDHLDVAMLAKKVRLLEQRPAGPVSLCTVPDDLIYLPHVLAAISAERRRGTLLTAAIDQALPIGGGNIDHNFTRVIARQDDDEPFTITLRGSIAPPGIPLQVYAPDGTMALQATAPEGSGQAYTIPRDGQRGEYVIFLGLRDSPRDRVLSPLTSLPREVYVMGYWSQASPSRFFTALPNGDDGQVVVQAHAASAAIHSGDFARTLASSAEGKPMTAPVSDAGVWINTRSVYVTMPQRGRLTLALDPGRFFVPTARAIAVQPVKTPAP
jgi:hypothetical protein